MTPLHQNRDSMAHRQYILEKTSPHTLADIELIITRVLQAAKGDYPSISEDTRRALVRYVLTSSGFSADSIFNRIYYNAQALTLDNDDCERTLTNGLLLDVPRSCTSDELPVAVSNACLMRCIVEKMGAFRQIELEGVMFSDEIAASIELYEKTFGKLTKRQFKNLFKHVDDQKSASTGYPIMQRPPTRAGYKACCAAADAYTHQHKIAKAIASGGQINDNILYIAGDPLWEELNQMSAPDAILLLSDGEIDIRNGWSEDEVSYKLADMLLGAMHEIYDDILDKENEEKHEIEPTRDWVNRMCDEHFVTMKMECFLDGVPMRDVLA